MKKISKIIFTFILLFLVGITSVSAASPTFYRWRQSNTTLMNHNLITYDWYEETNHANLYANDASYSGKEMYPYWNLYYVKDGSTYYITYCVNPNKDIHHGTALNHYTSLDNMRFSDGQSHPDRLELLKTLLLYGYNPDPTNSITPVTLITNDPQAYIKLIAMQVLVWEVMEGGRTTFDTVEPQWNGGNGKYSFYQKVIYPNGGNDPSQTGTLYYYYNKFREDARLADQAKPSTAFNESHYVLAWDNANKKYRVTVPGLGDYTTCTSNNNDVTVSVSGETATITSDKTVTNATITCKYIRGNGASNQSQTELFQYFSFKEDVAGTQDMVYGQAYKIFSKSFTVGTENTDFSIKKVDTENGVVSGAKFNLTHMTNTSYSVTIDSNTSTKYSLNYSGKYRVSEIAVPDGYEKINDFNITIDARSHKITNCDNSTSQNGVINSCLNGQVKIKYNASAIELTIVNVAKNFKIQKVNESGNPINGATFEIRDSNNNVVKFTRTSGNIFKYDTAGTVTSLSDASLSAYPISLLPSGDYKIVETGVPFPYRLPASEEERTTYIKIDANRNLLVKDKNRNTYAAAALSTVKIVNYTTEIKILKTGNGNPLAGVQFELYNADKSVKLSCNLVSPGVFNFADNGGTTDVYVTNSEGKITINSLPEGTYYLKEIATVDPFVLPSGNGVYTEIVIDIDENGVSVNGSHALDTINISNTPNSFNFYKRDTEGNPLKTGKYKLQKYDEKTKKYVDLKLVEVENDGTYNPNSDIYKVDSENGKIQFTLKKGVATFVEMESSSTYRIIETVAPEGYTKASTKDTATVHIDEYGNASGLLVLIDQKIVKEDDSASAELIINIQTGKQRIMYAAVIFVVIGTIVGLIIYNKRK